MQSRPPLLILAVWLLGILCWAPETAAQQKVEQLAQRLTDGSSFQLRVQAALALGASGTDSAVPPLCRALDDNTSSVRAAVGAALGRLGKPSALPCLRTRIGREDNAAVKIQLERAHERIEHVSKLRKVANASRAPSRGSRFYVAVDPTRSKVGTRKPDIELLVQATIRGRLMEHQNIGIAPTGQNKTRFASIVDDNRIRGFLLRSTVESIDYDGSNVSVALRLTLFSYPSMALQAEYSPKLSMTGTRQRDTEAENKLLQMAAERATEKFLETFK